MTEQLELGYGDRWRDRAIAEAWRRELRLVVEQVGVKRVAAELDRGHSELSRALDELERHYLRPDELVAIMRRDTTGRALKALAGELGYEISKRKELTPTEKLERLQAAVEAHKLEQVLYPEAFGPGGKP